LALPFRYAQAWSFAEGWAAVQVPAEHLDSLYFALPKPLQQRFDRELRQWRQAPVSEGLQQAYPQGGLSVAFIDRKGTVQQVLPVGYQVPPGEGPFRFEEGYLPVMALVGGGLGMLDREWREALPCRYEQLGLMREGCAFAVNRPTVLHSDANGWQESLQAEDTLFVGYLNPAGLPVFSLSPGFLSGTCGYRVEGLPMEAGQGLIWLHPLYCEQRIGLRINREGELAGYFELPLR
jgi:hypothetical protein